MNTTAEDIVRRIRTLDTLCAVFISDKGEVKCYPAYTRTGLRKVVAEAIERDDVVGFYDRNGPVVWIADDMESHYMQEAA